MRCNDLTRLKGLYEEKPLCGFSSTGVKTPHTANDHCYGRLTRQFRAFLHRKADVSWHKCHSSKKIRNRKEQIHLLFKKQRVFRYNDILSLSNRSFSDFINFVKLRRVFSSFQGKKLSQDFCLNTPDKEYRTGIQRHNAVRRRVVGKPPGVVELSVRGSAHTARMAKILGKEFTRRLTAAGPHRDPDEKPGLVLVPSTLDAHGFDWKSVLGDPGKGSRLDSRGFDSQAFLDGIESSKRYKNRSVSVIDGKLVMASKPKLSPATISLTSEIKPQDIPEKLDWNQDFNLWRKGYDGVLRPTEQSVLDKEKAMSLLPPSEMAGPIINFEDLKKKCNPFLDECRTPGSCQWHD